MWKKSSYSNALGNCVETKLSSTDADVRDSTNPDGPVLSFSRPDWEQFLRAIKQ